MIQDADVTRKSKRGVKGYCSFCGGRGRKSVMVPVYFTSEGDKRLGIPDETKIILIHRKCAIIREMANLRQELVAHNQMMNIIVQSMITPILNECEEERKDVGGMFQ